MGAGPLVCGIISAEAMDSLIAQMIDEAAAIRKRMHNAMLLVLRVTCWACIFMHMGSIAIDGVASMAMFCVCASIAAWLLITHKDRKIWRCWPSVFLDLARMAACDSPLTT